MWTREQIASVAKRKDVAVLSASVLSCAAGSLVAHLVTKKVLKTKYEQISEQEIKEAKLFYANQAKKSEATPEELASEIEEEREEEREDAPVNENVYLSRSSSYNGMFDQEKAFEADPIVKEEVEKVTQESVTVNVFEENTDDEPSYMPRPGEPYRIKEVDFFKNDTEYEQITLTYYEPDDVLADERDQPIEDVEATVGLYNLDFFGYGSKQKNILYVRNEELEVEYEITRFDRPYTEEVLGFVEHSTWSKKDRRFRGDDE